MNVRLCVLEKFSRLLLMYFLKLILLQSYHIILCYLSSLAFFFFLPKRLHVDISKKKKIEHKNKTIYQQQHHFIDLFHLKNVLLSVGCHNSIFLKDHQSYRCSEEEQKPFPAICITNGFPYIPCITCFTVQLSSKKVSKKRTCKVFQDLFFF